MLAALFATPSLAQGSPESSLRKKAEAMRKSLEKRGYLVQEGAYVPVDLAGLYCKGLADSCNGNNFGAPYHGYHIPNLEGQADAGGPFSFRLRRDEAIVVVGPTPPTCRLFSDAFSCTPDSTRSRTGPD